MKNLKQIIILFLILVTFTGYSQRDVKTVIASRTQEALSTEIDSSVFMTSNGTFKYVKFTDLLGKFQNSLDFFSGDYNDLSNIPTSFNPSIHNTTHENGGSDEIDVTGLSGILVENQNFDNTGDWVGTFDGLNGTYYLNRTNHTGTQLASTISNFNTEVSTNSSVVANTSKVSYPGVGNVDHSLLLNTHNLTTDIDHNQLLNYITGEHFLQSEINIPATQISFTPYLTLTSTNVQTVIEEVKDELDQVYINIKSPYDGIDTYENIFLLDPATYINQLWFATDTNFGLCSDGVNWHLLQQKSSNTGFVDFDVQTNELENTTTDITIPSAFYTFALDNLLTVKFNEELIAGEVINISDSRITTVVGDLAVGEIIRIYCNLDKNLGYQFTPDKIGVNTDGKIHVFDIAVADFGAGEEFIDESALWIPWVSQSGDEDRHNRYSVKSEGLSVNLVSVASGNYTVEIPTYTVALEGINYSDYFHSNRKTVIRETDIEKRTVLVVHPDNTVVNIGGQTLIDGNVYWNTVTESMTPVQNSKWTIQMVYIDKDYTEFGVATNGIVYVIPWQFAGTNGGYDSLIAALAALPTYKENHIGVIDAELAYSIIIKKSTSSSDEVVIGKIATGGSGGGSNIVTSLDKIENVAQTISVTAGGVDVQVVGDVVPALNLTYDLGTSTFKWDDLNINTINGLEPFAPEIFEHDIIANGENSIGVGFILKSTSQINYNGLLLRASQWSGVGGTILVINFGTIKYDYIIINKN